MASPAAPNNEISPNHTAIQIPIHTNGTTDPNPKPTQATTGGIPGNTNTNTNNIDIDYSERGQWLRAAVLGANDGLVSVASLMMGVGSVKRDIGAMLVAGFAGLVAGACSMAIGEFVSVYTQYDIEMARIKRQTSINNINEEESGEEEEKEKLPSPCQAALASALAFSVGAVVPLLAAVFIRDHRARLGVVGGAASLALLVFGGVGAVLGNTPVTRSCVRVLIGGWMAMAITFGLTKLIASTGSL